MTTEPAAPAAVRWLLFLALLAGVIGAIGFMGWFWFIEQERGRQALDWPTVDGVFLRNAVRGAKGDSQYVSFRYTVDGRTYHGWREGFAFKQGPRLDEGAPVKVYVKPGDPATAVIFPGDSEARWPFASGSILAAVCLLFAFAYRPWPGALLGERFLNWMGFLTAAGAALVAAWGIGFWCVELKRGFEARSWPTADGVFVTNGYSQRSSGKYGGGARVRSVYYYSVDGQRYQGFRMAFGWPRNVPPVDEGSAIKVYVRPGDPTMHVLRPGPTNNFWAPLAMAAFLLVFGGVAWLATPWPSEPDRKKAPA
jgi:hypothetical protein